MRLTLPGGIMLMVPTFGETGVGKEEEAPVWEAQEKNKALVRRYLEEQAKGNIAIIDELVAPDFVDRSLMPGQEPDREGYKRSIAELTAPFSDINITIEHQVAEGDMVMTWYTGSRIHDREPFMGVPPSGRRSTFTRFVLHRVVGGKILEEWSYGGTANILQPALE
jgi:predicted ester cyclase